MVRAGLSAAADNTHADEEDHGEGAGGRLVVEDRDPPAEHLGDGADADNNGDGSVDEGDRIRLSGEGEPIGVQTDAVEWRIHVRHQPGSFDALTGAAHGWKSLPKLELFGVEYLGPSRTYTRSER